MQSSSHSLHVNEILSVLPEEIVPTPETRASRLAGPKSASLLGSLCISEKKRVRPLRKCSEPILIPGDPKYHCGPPGRVRAYGGQVTNGVLA